MGQTKTSKEIRGEMEKWHNAKAQKYQILVDEYDKLEGGRPQKFNN